jgi:hypothetical protein
LWFEFCSSNRFGAFRAICRVPMGRSDSGRRLVAPIASATSDSNRWNLPRYVCGRDWRSPQDLINRIS